MPACQVDQFCPIRHTLRASMCDIPSDLYTILHSLPKLIVQPPKTHVTVILSCEVERESLIIFIHLISEESRAMSYTLPIMPFIMLYDNYHCDCMNSLLPRELHESRYQVGLLQCCLPRSHTILDSKRISE